MMATVAALLNPIARSRVDRMLGSLAPSANLLDRRFRAQFPPTKLRPIEAQPMDLPDASAASAPPLSREQERARIKALLAITPAAAARLRSLPAFFEQVHYSGCRLAKLNLPPEEVHAALNVFDGLLPAVLGDNFQPAREQLHLATVLALARAFYEVRERETQAFFSFYRASAGASALEDALRRIVRAFTRALHAKAGRFLRVEGAHARRLARPLYIATGAPEERFVSRDLLHGRYACYWSYPVNGQAALQFAFAAPYPWLPRELTLLGAAAAGCTEVMEKARLENDVRRLHAEALRAEQDERRRIGRELHDDACQSLLALRLELEMLEREASGAPAARLRAARQIAERAIAELRRAVASLSPAVLDRLGLRAALRRLGGRFLQMHDCKLRLRISGACERLTRPQEETVYRVAEESLRNCAKHSGATRVNLSLRSSDKIIRLRVADNGAGFCTEIAKDKPMSFGLAGMRERAALMGGALAIRSAPGKGAAIVLDLPPAARPGMDHAEITRTAH